MPGSSRSYRPGDEYGGTAVAGGADGFGGSVTLVEGDDGKGDGVGIVATCPPVNPGQIVGAVHVSTTVGSYCPSSDALTAAPIELLCKSWPIEPGRMKFCAASVLSVDDGTIFPTRYELTPVCADNVRKLLWSGT